MTESPTPDTDAAVREQGIQGSTVLPPHHTTYSTLLYIEPAFARKLERERDYARKQVKFCGKLVGFVWSDIGDDAIPVMIKTALIENDIKIKEVEAERDEANRTIDHLLAHCKDCECEVCSKIVCPHKDEMHFHHDGCPSCVGHEQLAAERDQLRNVCDELAKQLLPFSLKRFNVAEVSSLPMYPTAVETLTAYNNLPHVKVKGKQ